MGGDNTIGSGNNVNKPVFNARQIADELDAKDGKKDGKITKAVWDLYAEAHGGNKINSYINLNDAIRSINCYHKQEELVRQVKEEVKFTPPELSKFGDDEFADSEDVPTLDGGQATPGDVVVTGNRNKMKPNGEDVPTLDGGQATPGDVVVTGDRSKIKIPRFNGLPAENLTLNTRIDTSDYANNLFNNENKINVSEPAVYGSPEQTIPETIFLEMVERGELKPGDIVYAHTTSGGNSKSKVTILPDGSWKDDPIDS